MLVCKVDERHQRVVATYIDVRHVVKFMLATMRRHARVGSSVDHEACNEPSHFCLGHVCGIRRPP